MKLRTYLGIGAIAASTAVAGAYVYSMYSIGKAFDAAIAQNLSFKRREHYVDIASNIDKANASLAYCKSEDADAKSDGVCILLRQRGILQHEKAHAHISNFPDLEKRAGDIEKKIDDHLIDDHFKPLY